jgi:hypothetical protein
MADSLRYTPPGHGSCSRPFAVCACGDWRSNLEAQKVSRTSDAALAGQIASNLRLGRTFAYASEMEKRIAALTA